MKRIMVALGLFAGSFGWAYAAGSPFEVSLPRLSVEPPIDGVVGPAWQKAARLPVSYDFTYQRPGEPTTVYVAQDKTGFDIAFVASQKEPILSTARTDGSRVTQDDNVEVVFYPQGTQGFQYTFSANALGARYQTSSENTAYSPQWTAAARRNPDGYVVTMHIPFAIMRSGGSTVWHVQFERMIVAKNAMQVWSHEPGQRQTDDPAYAGILRDVAAGAAGRTRLPAPRLQLYALGEATTAAYGGNTSRVGADVAVPVTATSSLVGTFHPDYSNVEVDQQTIAPNAFARQYSEVRPFFTQLSSHFNSTFGCNNCPQFLYTPAIPSFREGYAYEGTQGPFNFAAFDAIGNQRDDNAQVVTYATQNTARVGQVSIQRSGVTAPGLQDNVLTITGGYLNQRTHFLAYGNAGRDAGTNVTEPGFATFAEYGVGYAAQNDTYVAEVQKVGSQFAPVDGYVVQNNIAGYDLVAKHTFLFAPHSPLQQVQVTGVDFVFHDQSGNPAQRQQVLNAALSFRDLLALNVTAGYTGYEALDGRFLPFNGNGISLSYKGQTTTPTSISYSGGSYYDGRLTARSYVTTIPLTSRLNVGLEADENKYAPTVATEPVAEQWLERATLDWQISRNASFDVGARRIIGRNLPNTFQAPDLPTPQAPLGTLNGYAPFDYVNAGNVSFALHMLAAHNEFYLVYGNPNSLQTTPALFIKWIRYIGAEKGT